MCVSMYLYYGNNSLFRGFYCIYVWEKNYPNQFFIQRWKIHFYELLDIGRIQRSHSKYTC
jgi:hypothetical protein